MSLEKSETNKESSKITSDTSESDVSMDNDVFMIDRTSTDLKYCQPVKVEIKETEAQKEARNRQSLADVFDQVAENCKVIENVSEIRRAESVKSVCDTESEFEFSDADSELGEEYKNLQVDCQNSDDEFDKLVTYSSHLIQKVHTTEYVETARKQKKNKKGLKNVREYDDLPKLENLSIECSSTLKKFGKVTKVVDCIVIVEPEADEVLDFDSYLFDKNGKSFGQVYDIFGQVKSPSYAVRYNTKEEADLVPIGFEVFFAPDEGELTKMPFKGLNMRAATREKIDTMNKMIDKEEAINRAKQNKLIEGVDSDVEFSDDEAEKEFRKCFVDPNRVEPQVGRKRDRKGAQKVRFQGNPHPQQQNQRHGQWDWHKSTNPKPFRRDVITSAPSTENPSTSSEGSKPAETSDNPYAEFGCYGGFTGRFGL